MIQESRIIDLTKRLISIPSVTGHEQPLSNWIYDLFQSLGLQGVQRLPVEEAGETVVGWIEGSTEGTADSPTLLFTFHLDTFDVFDGWQTDPFTSVQVGDRLYGLGAHDMKGGAACVLAAIEALVQSGADARRSADGRRYDG